MVGVVEDEGVESSRETIFVSPGDFVPDVLELGWGLGLDKVVVCQRGQIHRVSDSAGGTERSRTGFLADRWGHLDEKQQTKNEQTQNPHLF